jgi:hypothetical protein
MAPSARRGTLSVEPRYPQQRHGTSSTGPRYTQQRLGTSLTGPRYTQQDSAPPQQGHGILSRTRYLQQVTVHPKGGCGTLNRIGDSKHKRAAPQNYQDKAATANWTEAAQFQETPR